jgi:hypothetical protein
MMWLAIISLLVGAVLAQRFKVMVLLPVAAAVLAVVTLTAFAQAHTAWWTVSMAATVISSVQLGYLIGLGLHFVLEASVSQVPQSLGTTASSARQPARQH